jgi:signal transduction histidine kinase
MPPTVTMTFAELHPAQLCSSLRTMSSSPGERTLIKIGNLALLVVVGLTLSLALVTHNFAPVSGKAFLYYGFLAVYAIGGCAANIWMFGRSPRWIEWLYFLLQLALYGTMVRLELPQEAIWLLTLPVVSQAAVVLPWPAVIALAVGYLGLHCGLPDYPRWRWDDRVRAGLSLSSAYGFVVWMTLIAESARKARTRAEILAEELEKANAQLRVAATQSAALAAANERNRIARDIHDGLGHYLTGIAVQLQAARSLLPGQPARASEAIAKAEETSRTALDEIRHSVGALRAAQARPALDAAIAGVVQESGLSARFHIEGATRMLPDAAEQALFRTAQEGLTNVRKHAAGAWADVVLDFRNANCVRLMVTDAGPGAHGEPAGGFGLPGLRERVSAVGGTLAAGNCASGGFELRVEVPA